MKKYLAAIFTVICVCFAARQSGAEILGYPWATWGELSYSTSNDIEKGVKLDLYVEQGIDWTRLGGTQWIVNNFVGLGLVVSDHREDFWNNRIRPAVGLKLKHPVHMSVNDWGELAIGIRGEYFGYFHESDKSTLRGVAFFQWSFGGDWKKRR